MSSSLDALPATVAFMEEKPIPPATTLAGRIQRAARLVDIFTSAALARKMKLNRQTVHRWWSGEGKKPEPDKLMALADALDVSPRWLATGKGARKEENQLSATALEYAGKIDLIPPEERKRRKVAFDLIDSLIEEATDNKTVEKNYPEEAKHSAKYAPPIARLTRPMPHLPLVDDGLAQDDE